MNIIYHLHKMEEVLRTAQRHNDATGLFLKIPADTSLLWQSVIKEILAVLESEPTEGAMPEEEKA